MNYFTRNELMIYFISVLLVTTTYYVFDNQSPYSIIASLIGVTALIFNAKGNPVGQFLTVIFSLIYGYISYTFAYYGEMITYMGMTMPMALLAFITWMKHPFKGKKTEVEIVTLNKKDYQFMYLYTLMITFIFYFVLKYFHTKNLYISTLSITTSFMAVYLTYKRSPNYAIAYACNDLILIILWLYASTTDISYLSITTCFIVFFVNDLYAYINWKKIQLRQEALYE